MNRACDLCEKPVEPGQPRFGGKGSGDRTGPPLGNDRHYSCHVERFGRPGSVTTSEVFAGLREAAGLIRDVAPPARPVLAPVVKRGELNRSANAARSFTIRNMISEVGRRRGTVDCPFCNAAFTVYVWSLSGGGKRCPNCRAMFAGKGFAVPLAGNEDLS